MTETLPAAQPAEPPRQAAQRALRLKRALNLLVTKAGWVSLILVLLGIPVYLIAKHVSSFWDTNYVRWVPEFRRFLGAMSVAGCILLGLHRLLREQREKKNYLQFAIGVIYAVGVWIWIMVPSSPSITSHDLTQLQNANNSVASPPTSLPEALKRIADGARLSESDYFTRAQGELGLEHYPDAVRELESGSQTLTQNLADATFYEARAQWAWGRYNTSKYREALAKAQLSLILRPNFVPALLIECSSLRHLTARPNHLKEAMNACDEAYSLAPKNPEVYNERGGVLLNEKQFEDAITAFDVGISLDRNIPQLWSNRGVARHRMAKEGKGWTDQQRLDLEHAALADVQVALHIAPRFSDARLNKGTILMALGQKQEAYAIYQQMTQDDPMDAYAWNNLGDFIERQKPGDEETLREALSKFNRALDIEPDFEDAWFNRGDALLQLRDYSGAAEAFGRACKLNDGQDGDAWSELATTLLKLGKQGEAREAAKHALKLQPSNKSAKQILQGVHTG